RKAEESSPAFASMPSTPATCAASPLCEAQASASSSSLKPKRSAAPSVMSGKACKALTAERGKIADATSPMASTVLPSASLTAIAPRCRLSTMGPRTTSTRTGLGLAIGFYFYLPPDVARCRVSRQSGGMLCGLERLSIIIPALDEAPIIVETLAALAPLRARGAEVIVFDGGSSDSTPALARPLADRVISAPRNRGASMNAGAALASGDMFLFLHADTIVPENADRLIASALACCVWGRFDLRIAGQHPLLALVARMISWRSRLTGIATGDQAIFVTQEAFRNVGGFPDL